MVERASRLLVILWHTLVLLALAYTLRLVEPSRLLFLRPSAWRPVATWLQAAYFFRFVTKRAAVVFFIVALAAGILVLLGYLLERHTGWIVMLFWNGLGAVNYLPQLAAPNRQTPGPALFGAFVLAAILTVLSRPRSDWRRE